MLLPAIGEVGARYACGKFGPQRDRIAAAILEGVHLLRDDIGRLTQRTREDRGRLNHRQLQPLETIKPAHAFKSRDDMREPLLGFAIHILRATHRLRSLNFCHNARVPSGFCDMGE